METLTQSQPENSAISNAAVETVAASHQIILDSPLRKSLIPCIVDKAEFKIWADRDPDEINADNYVTIHQWLGKPEVVPDDLLDDTMLTVEMDRLHAIMNGKDLYLNTFTDIPARQLYQFITCELFNMEITGNIILRPWKLIYEEFYPTDEYLIRKHTSDFFRSMFGLEAWKYAWKRWKHVLENYKEMKSYIMQFKDFDDTEVRFDRIEILENEATVYFHARFVAIHSDGIFITRFDGPGEGRLHRNAGGRWVLNRIELPGELKRNVSS